MAEGIKDGKVVAGVFANMVGVTTRDIQLLCKNASIPAEKIGGVWYIPFPKGLQEYIKIYKDKAQGRGGEDREELEKRKLVHETSFKETKSRLAKIELDELEGKVHRAEDIEAVFNDLVYTVKSSILAFPGRCAVNWSKAKTAAKASQVLEDEARNVLAELSEYKYDPDRLREMVRDRLGKEQEENDDEQGDES